MSEYWKSTPKYWCKHCSCYVRDTKLERQNHESTGRHQGAIKRSLRELHRSHDREERDKERAKREIQRLNGIVNKDSPTTSSHVKSTTSQYQSTISQYNSTTSQFKSTISQSKNTTSQSQNTTSQSQNTTVPTPSDADLKRQREQLAGLGVAIPSSFRAEMAMAGDWTVTQTRVVSTTGGDGGADADAIATGVRKRHDTDADLQQREEDEAVRRLYKKPRRWGRDARVVCEEDAELDALLGGTIVLKNEGVVKREDPDDAGNACLGQDVKPVRDVNLAQDVKPARDVKPAQDVKPARDTDMAKDVKTEPNDDVCMPPVETAAPVVFKKRKPKGIRNR